MTREKLEQIHNQIIKLLIKISSTAKPMGNGALYIEFRHDWKTGKHFYMVEDEDRDFLYGKKINFEELRDDEKE